MTLFSTITYIVDIIMLFIFTYSMFIHEDKATRLGFAIFIGVILANMFCVLH